MNETWETLAAAIHRATADTARALLARPERFYYFGLTTTGEALAPVVSAWSHEALARVAADDPDPKNAAEELKWSYADSPYLYAGKAEFAEVTALIAARPGMTHDRPRADWDHEYAFRLSAMEEGVRRADMEGVFGTGAARETIAVLVEVMPPDAENVARAHRLNPPAAIADWLEEAAELNAMDPK